MDEYYREIDHNKLTSDFLADIKALEHILEDMEWTSNGETKKVKDLSTKHIENIRNLAIIKGKNTLRDLMDLELYLRGLT